MIQASFQPMVSWPHERTRNRRWRPFSAPWSATLDLLEREVAHLHGRSVLIGGGFRDDDLRLDGWPRAGAKEPAFPGIEISFDSRHGRLVYATDVCSHWQDNIRSIALGLQALRAVDRFGVAQRGQQYAGWKQLPAGAGRGIIIGNLDEAKRILSDAAGREVLPGDKMADVYRDAVKRTHPDQGGDPEAFLRVQAAYELLKGASS